MATLSLRLPSPQDDERLAKYTLWALANMVQLGRDASLVVDHAASALGGMGSLKQGLEAAVGLSSAHHIKNTQRMASSGVAQALAALLSRHEGNAAVCKWACRAVHNLARSKSLRAQLTQHRLRLAVEAAAKRHAADRGVVEWAAMATDILINGVPVLAPSPDRSMRHQESPRTSFSALGSLSAVAEGMTSGLTSMVGALDDTLGMGRCVS